MTISTSALIEIQSLIRDAIQSEDDTAARALDALLETKDAAYRVTAIAIAYYWLKPYGGGV
jgi:hypothetical protein